MCPLGGVLDCTSAGSLKLTPDGQVTDFSAADWNTTSARWCDVHGLDGGLFSYAGAAPNASTVAVDAMAPARNLKFNFTVAATGYAGGGLSFDSCVDASAFNAVQFTAAITAGSLTGCTLQVQIQTQDQRPTTATSPTGGTCTAATCYQFPATTIAAPPATPMTFTSPFPGFSNPAGSTIPTRTQIVGLQWQANSTGGTGTCTVELRIDDIKFITQ
jgi:hypothetical protein